MSNNFDLLWARIVRVTSFLAGLGIMGFETVADSSDRPWLYAAAIGMMGLPIARAAESILGKLSNSDSPAKAPGEKE